MFTSMLFNGCDTAFLSVGGQKKLKNSNERNAPLKSFHFIQPVDGGKCSRALPFGQKVLPPQGNCIVC